VKCLQYILLYSEVGKVTSKCNSITCYRKCPVFRAITCCSDISLNLDRAITLRCDDGSCVPRVKRLETITLLCWDKWYAIMQNVTYTVIPHGSMCSYCGNYTCPVSKLRMYVLAFISDLPLAHREWAPEAFFLQPIGIFVKLASPPHHWHAHTGCLFLSLML
jgi:hypothetical protein